LTAGKKSWKYGDSIALRVCGISKVAWCRPGDLHKVAGVLASNAAKYGWQKEESKQAK
jgi:hypothetical protein